STVPLALFPRSSVARPPLHSFPTRRSSDLTSRFAFVNVLHAEQIAADLTHAKAAFAAAPRHRPPPDRERFGMFLRPRHLSHDGRSEEHTSELQSRFDLVCRLLLEKKKTQRY